jgi:hypothetical protein
MQHHELERLIRLSQRTGDTLIIADPHGGESVVVLPVGKYEALIDAWSEGMESEESFRENLDEQFSEPEADIPELPLEEIRKMTHDKKEEDEHIEEMVKEPFEGPADEDDEERFYLEPIE